MREEMISIEAVAAKILVIWGKKVMLDSDLARLYEAETKNLNLQVKSNMERFPRDFMFQLTKFEALRLQSATSESTTPNMDYPVKPVNDRNQGP